MSARNDHGRAILNVCTRHLSGWAGGRGEPPAGAHNAGNHRGISRDVKGGVNAPVEKEPRFLDRHRRVSALRDHIIGAKLAREFSIGPGRDHGDYGAASLRELQRKSSDTADRTVD